MQWMDRWPPNNKYPYEETTIKHCAWTGLNFVALIIAPTLWLNSVIRQHMMSFMYFLTTASHICSIPIFVQIYLYSAEIMFEQCAIKTNAYFIIYSAQVSLASLEFGTDDDTGNTNRLHANALCQQERLTLHG